MRSQIQIISGFILVVPLIVASCLEPLEWNGSIEPSERLVVEGLITSETGPHVVKLSRTQEVIVEGEGPGVSGAEVKIYSGTEEFSLTEVAPGVYHTDSTVRGNVGEVYHLEVLLDDQRYEASALMVPVEPLDPVEIRPWAGNPNDPDGFQYFEFTYRSNFGNPVPMKYSVNLRLPDSVDRYYPEDWQRPSWIDRIEQENNGVLRDSTYYLHNGLEPPALFAYGEETYAGFTYGTIFTEKFYSLSSEHYDFIRSVMIETDWRGLGPFGYLPADVPTNLSNGALGWFGASDVTVVTQVVE